MSYSGLGQLRPPSSYRTPAPQAYSMTSMAPASMTLSAPTTYESRGMAPQTTGRIQGPGTQYGRTEMAPQSPGHIQSTSRFDSSARLPFSMRSAPSLDIPRFERARSLGQVDPSASYSNELAPMFRPSIVQLPQQSAADLRSIETRARWNRVAAAAPIALGIAAGAYVGRKYGHGLAGAGVGGLAGIGLLAGFAITSMGMS